MNLKKMVVGSVGLALVFSLTACGQSKVTSSNQASTSSPSSQPSPVTTASAKPAKVTYENTVKGIITQNCLACHANGAPSLSDFKKDEEKYKGLMKGPKLDTYADLVILVNGDDAGAVMRRLDDGKNTKDGKPGNMYQNLGATDEERQKKLALLKEWVGSWNLKKSKDLTPEERALITAVEK